MSLGYHDDEDDDDDDKQRMCVQRRGPNNKNKEAQGHKLNFKSGEKEPKCSARSRIASIRKLGALRLARKRRARGQSGYYCQKKYYQKKKKKQNNGFTEQSPS